MTVIKLLDQASKPQIRRMERARDLLNTCITDTRRRRVATAESVALISSLYCSVALLDREIGRHLMGYRDDGEDAK
jgi:hypothetical protein